MKTTQLKTDILILGAGIAGYETFRSLAKQLDRKGIHKHITIVDKNNFFTFVPMLHEVAAGAIEPTHCAIPLRELVHKTPHTFFRAEVQSVDPKTKTVQTSRGPISYEYCVVALGSTTNYFTIPGAGEHTYHVRSLDGAMKLHHDFIEILENNPAKRIDLVIVGGGYTGVEVAGQFSDFATKDIATLYPEHTVNVHIIETTELLLNRMPDKVRKRVTERIKKLGVIIHTGKRVIAVEKDAVILEGNKKIKSNLTIWTAGFLNIADKYLPKEYVQNGRMPVTQYLTHIADDSLYAIGDNMLLVDPTKDIPYPQLAEAAHHEGMYVARHIARRYKGKKKFKPFSFHAKGTLMPVGDWWGVMTIGKYVLFGRTAWWIRRNVYLFFLPGVLRKLKIAIDWTLHSLGFRFIVDTEHDS